MQEQQSVEKAFYPRMQNSPHHFCVFDALRFGVRIRNENGDVFVCGN